MNRLDRPSAIVLGGDTPIGLTVVRELGEEDVPVHVIAGSREGVGLYSRWTTTRHVRTSDDSDTIKLLNRISEAHGARYLLAVSEADRLLVRRAADENRLPGLHVLVPPLAQLRLVNDKVATYRVAREIGVPIPRTWEPIAGSEFCRAPSDLAYPCVLKWRDPSSVSQVLEHAGLPSLKAEYCYNEDELASALGRYRPIGKYPVVQEYCPGVGLGHMIFMHQGKSELSFQHIRRAEWPPEGGTSTVCSSLPPSFHPEWMAESEALLRRIGWEGAAMVEYRYDSREDRRVLMEINGRFWGSLPLAYHAGARFAWLTYAMTGLGETVKKMDYRPGVVCRYMIPETRRVLRVLFDRRAISDRGFRVSPIRTIAFYFAGFFRPSTRYYVFSIRDPAPFFVDMALVIRKMIGRRIFSRVWTHNQ